MAGDAEALERGRRAWQVSPLATRLQTAISMVMLPEMCAFVKTFAFAVHVAVESALFRDVARKTT